MRTMFLCHRPQRIGAFAAFAVAAVLAATPAVAATGTSAACEAVVQDLRAVASDVAGSGAQADTSAGEARAEKLNALFTNAAQEHPECVAAIQQFGAELEDAVPTATTVEGRPFWGPVGWLWNNVYYRVFNGNNIMMGLFGWALLLSPFILVFSSIWVLRGARGAFRRPVVPEHLRFDA